MELGRDERSEPSFEMPFLEKFLGYCLTVGLCGMTGVSLAVATVSEAKTSEENLAWGIGLPLLGIATGIAWGSYAIYSSEEEERRDYYRIGDDYA